MNTDEQNVTDLFDAIAPDGNHTLQIYTEAREAKGGWAYLDTIAVPRDPELLLEHLRREYQYGRFNIRLIRDSQYVKGGSRVLTLARLPGQEDKDAPKPQEPPVSKTDELLRELLLEMRTLRQTPPAPAINPVEMMTAVMGAMAQVTQPLASRLVELQTADAKAGVDMFTRGLELGRSLRGDEAPADSPLARALSELVPPLAARLTAGDGRQELAPAPASPPPDMPDYLAPFAAELPALEQAARMRLPARNVAEKLLELAGEEQILELAEADSLVDDAVNLHPPLASHRGWLERLHAELFDLTHATDADTPDHDRRVAPPPGGLGSSANARADAPGSPEGSS